MDCLERHAEFKVAYDRIGNKPYQESRRHVVKALIDFGREIARAVLVAGRRSRVYVPTREKQDGRHRCSTGLMG